MKPVSIWESTAGAPSHFPALSGDKNADVVIIGGGITGLTAAMLLSEAGKTVIVLEALSIGLGTTGNSTGNLYTPVSQGMTTIKSKWNKDVVKQVITSRGKAIDLVEHTVNKFSIDCDFIRTGFSLVTSLDEKEKQFKEEAETLAEAGLSVNTSTNVGLPFEVKYAVSLSHQAQFNPLSYCRQLAKAISNKVQIYEHTPVMDFDAESGEVKTLNGTVKGDAVIMATHTPKGVFFVHTVLGPYREYGVAAEVEAGKCPPGIFWTRDEQKHSIRSYERNGKHYLVTIGEIYKTGQAHDTDEYVKEIQNYMSANFGVKTFQNIWGAQQYIPADGLPYIGKQSDKLYIATGFASDGLTYGTLSAMILADQISGKENDWSELYKYSRHTPLKSFKEFFKENINVAGQMIKDVPWTADKEELNEIKNGEAKIIEKDSEKLACYRDESGKLNVVSAVCTHMKCIVHWNGTEKSWDCPCHGSRFKPDGKVIEGPATDDLKSKL